MFSWVSGVADLDRADAYVPAHLLPSRQSAGGASLPNLALAIINSSPCLRCPSGLPADSEAPPPEEDHLAASRQTTWTPRAAPLKGDLQTLHLHQKKYLVSQRTPRTREAPPCKCVDMDSRRSCPLDISVQVKHNNEPLLRPVWPFETKI